MVQKRYAAPRSKRAKSLSRPHNCDDIWDVQKAFFFSSSPQRLARHRRCYEADGFWYLDRVDGRSGRLHTSYYAAINEQPPKKKGANGPHTDEHAHAQINTNAKTGTRTVGWKVTVYSVCIRERYLKGRCCLLLRSAHKRRHPYKRCYINLKESRANAPHVDLFFPQSILITFRERTATFLPTNVTLGPSLLVCMEGKQALKRNNIVSFLCFSLGARVSYTRHLIRFLAWRGSVAPYTLEAGGWKMHQYTLMPQRSVAIQIKKVIICMIDWSSD